jgi:hypothetical protein
LPGLSLLALLFDLFCFQPTLLSVDSLNSASLREDVECPMALKIGNYVHPRVMSAASCPMKPIKSGW